MVWWLLSLLGTVNIIVPRPRHALLKLDSRQAVQGVLTKFTGPWVVFVDFTIGRWEHTALLIHSVILGLLYGRCPLHRWWQSVKLCSTVGLPH